MSSASAKHLPERPNIRATICEFEPAICESAYIRCESASPCGFLQQLSAAHAPQRIENWFHDILCGISGI